MEEGKKRQLKEAEDEMSSHPGKREKKEDGNYDEYEDDDYDEQGEDDSLLNV